MGKKKLFTPEDFDKVVDKPWYKKPIIWFACAFIVALIITGFCFLKLKPEVQTSGPEGGAVRPDTVPEVITPQDTLVSEPINESKDTISGSTEQPDVTVTQEGDAMKYESNTPDTKRGESFEIDAKKAIRGDYGNGKARKQNLGTDYNAIQSIVNQYIREGKIYW